jgi:hypothetical protein
MHKTLMLKTTRVCIEITIKHHRAITGCHLPVLGSQKFRRQTINASIPQGAIFTIFDSFFVCVPQLIELILFKGIIQTVIDNFSAIVIAAGAGFD